MANIRKPINNPLGGSGQPAKLPPLPVQASGTMAPSTPQAPAADTPIQNPHLPAPNKAAPLPPLPGRPVAAQAPTPVEQEVEETPEFDEEVESDSLWDVAPDDVDDEFEDEEEILLSEDEEALVDRLFFSTDPNIAEPTIHALLDQDGLEWEVCEALASNPSTPHYFLVALAQHENDLVRQAVMENETISDELYESFIDDEEIMVVAAFLENPRTTPEMALRLADHEDSYIRILVKQSPLLTDSQKAQVKV